jgi:hypothetical protein
MKKLGKIKENLFQKSSINQMDDSVVIVVIVGVIVIIIAIGIIIGSHIHLRSYLQQKRVPRQYLTTTIPAVTATDSTNGVQPAIFPSPGVPSLTGPAQPFNPINPMVGPTGSTGVTTGSIAGATGPTGTTVTTKPAKNVVLLGTVCPANWTDIGEAGVLYSQQQLNTNPGFRLGASASPGWQWIHPRLCAGNTSRIRPGSGLFGLTNNAGLGPAGVLAPTTDLPTVPFTIGATADSGWTWVEPNLVDAATSNVFDLVGSQDPAGQTSVGLVANTASLNNLQTLGVAVGSEATPGWNWVYPRIYAN